MRRFLSFVCVCAFASATLAQTPDLTKTPTLYVVPYAHLDTQWRWEFPQTISEFLPKTMRENFALFDKYPHYVFNFSGANRYRLMKEYFPADYARLQAYARAGRWFPAGSSMEEGDVNSPSAESIVRQILYGTQFFRRDLGRTSAEYMLPDCFGFPASLPSILAYMGLKGFSTQKLTWGSNAPVGGPDSPERTPRGTPFNVGWWIGPDGRGIIAAFNPGSYGGDVRYDLSKSDPANTTRGTIDWPQRVARDGAVSGIFADYHYYGTGDTGGSPSEASVAMMEHIVTANDGPLHVVQSTSERMFLDIPADAHLPRYEGDLELTNHSAGSLTSEAMQKRWNHDNELLADAAERASVAAMWLGGRLYPQQRLDDAWTLVMGGQFHDTAAGTATPKAYEYAWNDDLIARNQFLSVLGGANDAVSEALDTTAKGTPVIVYNPLDIAREDVVAIDADGGRVFDPDGREVPAQRSGGKLLFLAKVPSAGFAVYDVRAGGERRSALRVSTSSLENQRYRVSINANGDIASIFDKALRRELLAAPIRLAFLTEKPRDWPAWNMDWADQSKPPRAYVAGPAAVRVVERGPMRVALEIAREAEGSKFVETISLADGSDRIEIANAIDWRTPEAALKAVVPLGATNPQATYNWDVGTIRRANDNEKSFEVPTHEWIDLSDAGGAYGVTILTGAKYGSDKPADDTLRLTLLYTPGLGSGNGRSYADQTSQDWGHHEFVYGLAAHAGTQPAEWEARRLSQPLIAFLAPKHPGALGKRFSFLQVSSDRIRVMALKKAEESDDVVVRVVNLDDKPHDNVMLTFPSAITAAREVNGQEIAIGPAVSDSRSLRVSFGPYAIRSFAVTLAPPRTRVSPPRFATIPLQFDRVVATRDGVKSNEPALPAEMLPAELPFAGIRFDVTPNALTAHGQTIALPPGFDRIHLLANAAGDQRATFRIGSTAVDATIQDQGGFIGQWDTRVWRQRVEPLPPYPDAPPNAPPRSRTVTEFAGLTPAFLKPAPIAWFASHHHDPRGANVPYAYSYLFDTAFDVPLGATTLTLPDNDKIRILAITMSKEAP